MTPWNPEQQQQPQPQPSFPVFDHTGAVYATMFQSRRYENYEMAHRAFDDSGRRPNRDALNEAYGPLRSREILAHPTVAASLASHLDIRSLDHVFQGVLTATTAAGQGTRIPTYAEILRFWKSRPVARQCHEIHYNVFGGRYSGTVDWGTVAGDGGFAYLTFRLANNGFVYSPPRELFGDDARVDPSYVSSHGQTVGNASIAQSRVHTALPTISRWALEWFPNHHPAPVLRMQWFYNHVQDRMDVRFRLGRSGRVCLQFCFEPMYPLAADLATLWERVDPPEDDDDDNDDEERGQPVNEGGSTSRGDEGVEKAVTGEAPTPRAQQPAVPTRDPSEYTFSVTRKSGGGEFRIE